MIRARYLLPAIILVFASAYLLQGQQPGQELKGQVKIGSHKVKLEAGKLYEFVLNGPQDFDLNVDMVEAPLNIMMGNEFKDDRYFYLPNRTDEYHLFVLPGPGIPMRATYDYSIKVRTLSFGKKPLLEVKSKWTEKDPDYKQEWDRYMRAYRVEFKVGKLYVIDLVADAAEVDPYLFLEDAKGQVVARDDDGGEDLSARIVYAPKATGQFRIVATTLEKATGGFTLTVRQVE